MCSAHTAGADLDPSAAVPDRKCPPFSERLRKFRDSLGFSRADLAAELGITPVTLYRWETGSTRPSPLAAEKLRSMGFGATASDETNAGTVPRLKSRASKKRATAAAAELREAATIVLDAPDKRMTVLPAPFVRNGPPDQAAFHRRLLDLQIESPLPVAILGRRLSMVEEVDAAGQTSQHRLEKPRPVSVSWSSNYGSHGWHRYVGRFPPHVVRALLNHFGADSHSVVCDPFAGSGTTAVECRLLGIPFIGIEICPLSAMMTRTKAAFPSDSKLLLTLAQRFVAHYDSAWKAFVGKRDVTRITHGEVLARRGNSIPAFANVERWFTSEALLGTSIAVEFGMQQQGFAREAVLLALSARMRSIGNVDVDVVRAEYSKTPRTNVDVGTLVARQLTKMAGDISSSVATHAGLIGSASDITVHEGSVLDVDLGKGTVNHIITSPPYGVEAISYLRTHLLSYRSLAAHLGHDPYDTRDKTIGSEYLTDIESDAGRGARDRSKACRSFFEKNQQGDDAKYGQRRAAMMQFCDDMLSVGERMSCWLKRGGRVAFVIGNKRLGDEVIPMDTIVTELFATCGLTPVDAIRHKLKTNNSNSQVPWQERIIQEESILLFKRARA
ncbi:MAG: DNA (cytosine-5-)-methyltransferase [Polyangiaceae bacterium]|nr:DNA (cytosine-5-)-methyltransferase [Polyangiaceae bacterium]